MLCKSLSFLHHVLCVEASAFPAITFSNYPYMPQQKEKGLHASVLALLFHFHESFIPLYRIAFGQCRSRLCCRQFETRRCDLIDDILGDDAALDIRAGWNIIHDIHISQDSIIYIGTEDKGLNEISNIEKNILFKHWDNNHGLSQNSIHGLTSTKDAVWVGTINKGIDVINKKDGKIIKHYDLNNSSLKISPA